MIFVTHILFGLVTGFLVCEAINCNNPLIFVPLAGFSALIPDIDTVTSFIGRRIPLLSIIFNAIFGHRGPFHSIWLPILSFWLLIPLSFTLAAAVTTGITSHIISDALTKGGVRPIWPIPLKISGPVKTGGLLDTMFAIVLLGATVILIFDPPLPVDTITGFIVGLI